MINIHHLTNSRSQRVIWLLEELGLEYIITFHERDKKTQKAAESLHNVHSLGKSPVLIDNAVTLAETGAIFDYLLETYDKDKLIPPNGNTARVNYLYWKNFAEASLMPYLAMTKLFSRVEQGTPFIFRPIARLVIKKINAEYLHANLANETNLIEQHLGEHQWFAGDQFTAVDILVGFTLDALAGKFITNISHPNSCKFVDEIKRRSAYQRAQAKGKWCEDEFNLYWSHLKITS